MSDTIKARAPRVIVTLRVGQMDQLLPILATGDLDLVVGRIPDDPAWRSTAQMVHELSRSAEALRASVSRFKVA